LGFILFWLLKYQTIYKNFPPPPPKKNTYRVYYTNVLLTSLNYLNYCFRNVIFSCWDKFTFGKEHPKRFLQIFPPPPQKKHLQSLLYKCLINMSELLIMGEQVLIRMVLTTLCCFRNVIFSCWDKFRCIHPILGRIFPNPTVRTVSSLLQD
jgi:hypothetical protein